MWLMVRISSNLNHAVPAALNKPLDNKGDGSENMMIMWVFIEGIEENLQAER